jgi:hypothetical protein
MSETRTMPGVPAAGTPPIERRRWLLPAGLGVVVLAVLLTLVALLGSRQPTVYQPGTPEHAFQGYYLAWEADDLETAYAWFSTTVKKQVSFAEYRGLAREWYGMESGRVTLDRVDRTGSRATLRLRVDYFSDGGFGGSRWSNTISIRLVEEADGWRIDETLVGLQPAPMYH